MVKRYEMNLIRLVEHFRSEDKCRRYLQRLRWPEGVVCPKCQSRRKSQVKDRVTFSCRSCLYQFSVTSGTMLHDTHLPLWKWLLAVYMVVESKKGVSANQLKRTLEVSYRTAWYLCHRIRKAMESREGLLRGIVEIDETYVGGKRKLGHRGRARKGDNPRAGKTMVLGAVQRGGSVRLHTMTTGRGTPSKENLSRFIRDNVDVSARVYTDDHTAYPGILKDHAAHQSVNHSRSEWVRGDVHTNTMEGAWGLFKRSIVGAYHQISVKHLDAYLDEFEFRYNNRNNPHLFRDALKLLMAGDHVEYRELIDGEKPENQASK